MLDNINSPYDVLPDCFERDEARTAAYADFGYSLPEEAMRYARRLTSDPKYGRLMNALDNIHMPLEFSRQGILVNQINTKEERPDRVSLLGSFYEPISLARIFSGDDDDAAVFVAEIEERARKAAQVFSTGFLALKFRTIAKTEPLYFHDHHVPGWAGIYTDPPTETADAAYVVEKGICTDESKISPLPVGRAVIIPEGEFHREQFAPAVCYRLWNSIFPSAFRFGN